MTVGSLLSRLRAKRDPAVSLADLYGKYAGVVRGRCAYLVGSSDAEDAMQDVFARAHEQLHTLSDAQAALGWLLAIATRHCLNVRRARSPKWREELERRALIAPVGQVQGSESTILVRRLLERFDPETQAIAVHYYVDEMSLDEVAALVGRSVPTVRKRLATFASEARTALEAEGGAT